MGEIIGTIVSKSGSQYIVKWEDNKVSVRKYGTFGWDCVARKVHKVDALSAAQGVIDYQNPLL
ncbi:MAG: hypothetical protein ABFS32_08145 [Bacteroidota bacterium]